MTNKVIDKFDREYHFLSNFASISLTFRGHHFTNAEAAFQSQKCSQRISEFENLNPSQAKRLGRQVPIRPDWKDVRDQVMYEVVYEKFYQNPEACERLKATGDATLIEGNTWNDRYWGVCNGKGQNRLGEILMRVREELSENTTFFTPCDEAYRYGEYVANNAIRMTAELLGYDIPVVQEAGIPDPNVMRGLAETLLKKGETRFIWMPQFSLNAEFLRAIKPYGWFIADVVKVATHKIGDIELRSTGYLMEHRA